MAEGGRSQSEITLHKEQPIRGSESARTRSERTLISFESFESTTMLPDCRGWLVETESGKQFWCVAASKMLGLFSRPEADEPIKVLTLTDFQVETFVNDVDMTINGAGCPMSCEKHVSSTAALKPRKQKYVIELKPLCKGDRQHSFLVPSEEEHLLWRTALQASCRAKVPSSSRRDKMLKQKKISFEEPCRTDSGLGDDLEPPLDHRKSESGDTKIQEPTFFANGSLDFENRSDQVRSRGSSFVSSVATIDDLADSNSTSDSASVDNNSAVNLSEFEFPDLETNSCGRQSLNDSVFLGVSQELDQWSDSKDADCFTSDGDSLPTSPHPRQTSSSMSSAGDLTEGPVRPPSDQTKTMIGKVSKLVHRVAHMRRPRSNSSLTLAQVPDSKMSGPMRKKGKLRWYVLSGTCLYCFKSNSKDEEAEMIYDLSSYSVALATEEKEDKRSICILKLTHSSGKKVLFTINNMETAQLWFSYTQDAIQEACTSKSRSDSQRSTSSNPESQSLGRNRLSRQSFEDSYGFFERQSSLRCVRDALQNAVSESAKIKKQDSSSGSSGGNDEKQEGGSLSDFESLTPIPATHWASSEDLSVEFTEKKSHPAIRFIMKHSSKSPLLRKRSLRQMPIPASDIVDPTMTGFLSVYVQNKGTWKKYWTVLKDNWLYFYKRPTDTSTSDIIDLPSYTIQRERMMTESAPLTQQRFIFSITDEDGADRAILMADTEKDTRAWMDKLKSQAKHRRSTTLDGLNLESGLSSLQLQRTDSHGKPPKWQKNQTELHKQRLLQEVLQQNQGGQQRAVDSTKSALELESPEVTKKRAEILTKYQKANDNEEEEQVRLMTLLNRRRMSAQVKKDVLERTMASRAKRRMERIGSVEEASMEEQIRILNERLNGIEAEMHAKSSQKRSRVQSLKEKEDLELQLLEQKDRLSRYRLKTHDALKSTSEISATLDEMDEETVDFGEDSTESPKRRESPILEDKDDETDGRDETPGEKVSKRLSPSVQRRKTDDDSQTDKSPNTRRRRLLPSLPDKAEPKLNTAVGKGDIPCGSSHQQEKLHRTGEKSPTVNHKKLSEVEYLRQRSVSDVLERKTPSPTHSRKISVEAQLLSGTNDVTTPKLEASHRSDSVPHLPQASKDVSRGPRTMKHSASSSDMNPAIKKSPGQRRAKEYPIHGTPSPPKPRRKISVPIRMPSMDNLFHSSSSKGSKDKTRKISSSSLSNITKATYKVLPQNGDSRSLSSSSSSIPWSTPPSSGSPDINGNMHPRIKGHGGQVEEIDPEVLRDIEEFEMMARQALRDAGWTLR